MSSIKKKNIIYRKFIKTKNLAEKTFYITFLIFDFKHYRNLVTKLS